jgi:hypothetical protein
MSRQEQLHNASSGILRVIPGHDTSNTAKNGIRCFVVFPNQIARPKEYRIPGDEAS